MSSVDALRSNRTLLQWCRVDPALPAGIHAPKMLGDVGWDLEAMETVEIPPMESRDVPVNARLSLPPDMWAEVRARSSIARKGLQVDAGTIDNGYRGPLFALIRNMAMPFVLDSNKRILDTRFENTVVIHAGERIAQLVFYRMTHVWAREIPHVDADTMRGVAGFGSTGA